EFISRRGSFIGLQGLAGELLNDDFEDGRFLLWEAAAEAGGSVVPAPTAALSGELGAEFRLAAGQVAFLERDFRSSEDHLHLRFLFDPGNLGVGLSNEVRLVSGARDGVAEPTISLRLVQDGTVPSLLAFAELDSGDRAETGSLPIPSIGASLVELDWRAAAPGGTDGSLVIKIQDLTSGAVAKAEALGLNNENQRVEILRLGQDIAAGAATQGSMALDRLEVWR
ncbi:MAG: hypothetical protein KDD47_11220, partial [Acidobacteria bacterium]|nr:hypothetical protein [Acidobacteriota bacterium]